MLRFRADSRDGILAPNCPIDCWLLANATGTDQTSTLKYGLYRLIVEGIRRVEGQIAGELELEGYHRRYEYHSGRPYWVSGNLIYHDHPGGYERGFDHAHRRWAWYRDGSWHAWDTPSLQG